MSTTDEPGRLRALVSHETGWDVNALERELEDSAKKVYALRQRLAPLRSELALLQTRFASKGRSPSHWDVERSLLLSELKEEARDAYDGEPKYKETTRGPVKLELTDGRCEDIAHAHLRYRKFVAEAWDEQKRIAELGGEIAKLYDRLETWKARREFLKTKLEQIKAETYLFAAQIKLT